jgi:hypothetical protein
MLNNFHEQFYFVASGSRIVGHENPDNNLESFCTCMLEIQSNNFVTRRNHLRH